MTSLTRRPEIGCPMINHVRTLAYLLRNNTGRLC